MQLTVKDNGESLRFMKQVTDEHIDGLMLVEITNGCEKTSFYAGNLTVTHTETDLFGFVRIPLNRCVTFGQVGQISTVSLSSNSEETPANRPL